MTKPKLVLALASALFVGACSSALPPPELVSARSAYQKAASGNAPRLKPAELHVAKQALDAAEAEFKNSPGEPKVADMAYVAQRKAEYADSQANTALAVELKQKYQADAAKAQSELLEATTKKVKGLEGQVAEEKAETAKEKAARISAEKKAQDAMDALSKQLAVKSEERGTVITLPGGVLFGTGQSTLLPGAQSALDKVATALSTQTERHFVVEGHTDNQGNEPNNQLLSQKRAEAVRDYLIVHGVSADSITAVGKGSTQPVGDNKTVEGRAMNRRVEVIVQNAK